MEKKTVVAGLTAVVALSSGVVAHADTTTANDTQATPTADTTAST